MLNINGDTNQNALKLDFFSSFSILRIFFSFPVLG